MLSEMLRTELRGAGWRSGTFKGFWRTNRSGIEFEVGARQEAVLLRYRYHTEQTNAEGEEALPVDADLARVEDAMTGIYLRIHEKPDVTRVWGANRRRQKAPPPRAAPAPVAEPDATQTALDF